MTDEEERAEKLAALAADIGPPRRRATVWFGHFGPDVLHLQRQLAAAGLYDERQGDEPGQFGPLTERALRAYQLANGLPNTAVCDDGVWAWLR